MKGSKSFLAAMGDDAPFRIFILDRGSGRYVEILQAVMQLVSPKSHIPEIYAVFGKEQSLKFLDIFAGMTLKVPPREVIEKCMRDVVIYMTLAKENPSRRPKAVKALAHRYGTSSGDIRQTFIRVEKALAEQQMQA